MPLTYEKDDLIEEPKDRTALVWVIVGIVLIVAVAALWWKSQPSGNVSQVRAKHILIKCNQADPNDRARAQERAIELRQRILAGESFAKLAKDYSDDPESAARGGDLGYYPKNSFEEAFEKYVWEAPLNQLSDVVKTAHGFHLIVVLDRHLSKADAYEQSLKEKATQQLEGAPEQ